MGGLKAEAEKRKKEGQLKGAAITKGLVETFPPSVREKSRDQYGKAVECEWAVWYLPVCHLALLLWRVKSGRTGACYRTTVCFSAGTLIRLQPWREEIPNHRAITLWTPGT
jgi:hypothetical protein